MALRKSTRLRAAVFAPPAPPCPGGREPMPPALPIDADERDDGCAFPRTR